MTDKNYDDVQARLAKAISEDAPCTFDEPIPVLVTLDNGVQYKGTAYQVDPKSDNFPEGLVMVRTATSDLGVPITYIRGR